MVKGTCKVLVEVGIIVGFFKGSNWEVMSAVGFGMGVGELVGVSDEKAVGIKGKEVGTNGVELE